MIGRLAVFGGNAEPHNVAGAGVGQQQAAILDAGTGTPEAVADHHGHIVFGVAHLVGPRQMR